MHCSTTLQTGCIAFSTRTRLSTCTFTANITSTSSESSCPPSLLLRSTPSMGSCRPPRTCSQRSFCRRTYTFTSECCECRAKREQTPMASEIETYKDILRTHTSLRSSPRALGSFFTAIWATCQFLSSNNPFAWTAPPHHSFSLPFLLSHHPLLLRHP